MWCSLQKLKKSVSGGVWADTGPEGRGVPATDDLNVGRSFILAAQVIVLIWQEWFSDSWSREAEGCQASMHDPSKLKSGEVSSISMDEQRARYTVMERIRQVWLPGLLTGSQGISALSNPS